MFYGIPTDRPEDQQEIGGFHFSLRQVAIGIQASLLMFPINMLIINLFKRVKPKPQAPDQQPKTSMTEVRQTQTPRSATQNIHDRGTSNLNPKPSISNPKHPCQRYVKPKPKVPDQQPKTSMTEVRQTQTPSPRSATQNIHDRGTSNPNPKSLISSPKHQ